MNGDLKISSMRRKSSSDFLSDDRAPHHYAMKKFTWRGPMIVRPSHRYFNYDWFYYPPERFYPRLVLSLAKDEGYGRNVRRIHAEYRHAKLLPALGVCDRNKCISSVSISQEYKHDAQSSLLWMGVGVYRPNPNKHIPSSIRHASMVHIVGQLIIKKEYNHAKPRIRRRTGNDHHILITQNRNGGRYL